jgi:hypothetical protein
MGWHCNQSRILMPFDRAIGLAMPLDNTLGTATALRTMPYAAFERAEARARGRCVSWQD